MPDAPMNPGAMTGRPTADYARLAAAALAASALVLLIGWVPAARFAPEGGRAALLISVSIALGASLAGAFPIAWSLDHGPMARHQAILFSMALRMGLTLAIFAGVVLLGEFAARGALGLWTGVSYAVLLSAETLTARSLILTRGTVSA